MFRKKYSGQERRKYIRLGTVFPVQFRLLSNDGKQVLSQWLQGFTDNIGRGGMCLAVNYLNPELADLIKSKSVRLSLDIETPITRGLVHAQASPAWMQVVDEKLNKYNIGLKYEQIDYSQNDLLMRYAWTKKLFVPTLLTAIFILGATVLLYSLINTKLVKGNKALVGQLVKIVQETSMAKQRIKQISNNREELQIKIQVLQLRIETVDAERKSAQQNSEKLGKTQADKKLKELNVMIEQLTKEKLSLQEQLIALQRKEGLIAEELLRLDKRKATLEKGNFDKMYHWLRLHQDPRTGLVMSFEGNGDSTSLAFTYDQALAVQAYANSADFERARRILDFFARKAKRIDGRFINVYYVNDGRPAEYVVHSDPNMWLGMAIIQYAQKSQDHSYLELCEDIAQSMVQLQNQSKDGSIRGGPNLEWCSVDCNLNAYAFFNMLYNVTNKQKYLLARDKVLNWLVKNTSAGSGVPLESGKKVSPNTLDTNAWSIAAIGPQRLEELGVNPDRLVEFAEENWSTEVSYVRPEGQAIRVKGFDFKPKQDLPKGGVVSSENTSQMVIVFNKMADFYFKKEMIAKARSYANKADTYMAELIKMVIPSSSLTTKGESCFPYATPEMPDTDHSLVIAKSKELGSVSGTVYAIFAYCRYNPLELKEK